MTNIEVVRGVGGSVINGCRTTKIYCRPNCPPGRRTKPQNRVHFSTVGEALNAGFRACKVCTPDAPTDGQPWRPKRPD